MERLCRSDDNWRTRGVYDCMGLGLARNSGTHRLRVRSLLLPHLGVDPLQALPAMNLHFSCTCR